MKKDLMPSTESDLSLISEERERTRGAPALGVVNLLETGTDSVSVDRVSQAESGATQPHWPLKCVPTSGFAHGESELRTKVPKALPKKSKVREETKACSECGRVLPRSHFSKRQWRRSNKDALSALACLQCTKDPCNAVPCQKPGPFDPVQAQKRLEETAAPALRVVTVADRQQTLKEIIGAAPMVPEGSSTSSRTALPPPKEKKKKANSDFVSGDTLYCLPPPSRSKISTPRWKGPDAGLQIDALVEKLQTEGVCVIEDVYTEAQLEKFRRHHTQIFEQVQRRMRSVKPRNKPYRHDFDKKRYYIMPHYEIEEEEDVIEIAPGRLDYNWGMYEGVFGSAQFQRPAPLAELMERLLIEDYACYSGALPSGSHATDGPWHRDSYLLFDDEVGANKSLLSH